MQGDVLNSPYKDEIKENAPFEPMPYCQTTFILLLSLISKTVNWFATDATFTLTR